MPTDHEWPDALDALIAAPEHHALLFENDCVRVIEARVPPGQTVPLHTHRWPAAQYVLSWSDFVRRDAAGETQLDSRMAGMLAPGSAAWSAPLGPHTLENVGTAELRVIAVEQKMAK
ncbi:MAG TPA: hypothetical protein VE291_08855 [Terracidiphilus sp.]|jgi:hypothetical protein|nr:hypothetical protein [Terracidiphilus sp.]